MLYLFRFFRGFLKIEISGQFCEKALDIAAQYGISLWNIRLISNVIQANIYINDFKRIRPLIRKKEIKIHILKRYGFPFILNSYHKRMGIIVGIALFFIILNFLSSFIWIIDVTGNKKIVRDEIISACKKIGIDIGARGRDIEPKSDCQRLMLNIDGLSWVSLNVEGSRLTVNVSEIKSSKDSNAPSNLVASNDGIIKKINVKKGNCLVKTGDAVKKGDILVSGIIESAANTVFVKSKGDITAVTTQYYSVSDTFIQKELVKTGKNETKYLLEVFGIKIPLFLGEYKGEYISDLKCSQLRFFKTALPISIYKKSFYNVKNTSYTLSNIELCEKLRGKMRNLLSDKRGNNYIIKTEEFLPADKGLIYNVLASGEENIAQELPMVVTNKE